MATYIGLTPKKVENKKPEIKTEKSVEKETKTEKIKK
jgi:hypothetical protein